MNETKNAILSKPFLLTLFWKQNKYHRHGVLVHTLRVAWYAMVHGDHRMIPAALLHDIGKPVSAHQKPKDIINEEYSFTDHEERSYLMIEEWKFISDYTKELVRYHYLIRDMSKHKTKNPARYKEKKESWNELSDDTKANLERFLKYDDLAKGIEHNEEKEN